VEVKTLAGIALGLVASAAVVHVAGIARGHNHTRTRLVAEDASAPLSRVAIHYAPSADPVALGVWKQLFAVLPAAVDVQVEVTQQSDFDRLIRILGKAGTPHLDRMHPVIVGAPITTWS